MNAAEASPQLVVEVPHRGDDRWDLRRRRGVPAGTYVGRADALWSKILRSTPEAALGRPVRGALATAAAPPRPGWGASLQGSGF